MEAYLNSASELLLGELSLEQSPVASSMSAPIVGTLGQELSAGQIGVQYGFPVKDIINPGLTVFPDLF